MNSRVSNTSTPISSQECAAIFSKITETCSAELREMQILGSKVPKELQYCYSTNSCTLEQNQEFLKHYCPIFKKFNDCSGPAMDCLVETMPNKIKEQYTRLERECDAFSASSGSTNTTTSGNRTTNNNSSTPPISQECRATILPLIRTCSAEFKEIQTLGSKVPKELKDCYSTNSCTLEQNQELLKLYCPIFKKFNDCSGPAVDCLVETMPNKIREQYTRLERECDAFSASSGSTNTTTSGNGKPTNTTTSGNGKPTNTTTSANDTTTSGNDTTNSGNDTTISGNDTTTSGNDTITSGNDTITSGNGKNVASLFSILAFSLFLL